MDNLVLPVFHAMTMGSPLTPLIHLSHLSQLQVLSVLPWKYIQNPVTSHHLHCCHLGPSPHHPCLTDLPLVPLASPKVCSCPATEEILLKWSQIISLRVKVKVLTMTYKLLCYVHSHLSRCLLLSLLPTSFQPCEPYLLCLKYARLISISEPLHLLFSLLRMLFPQLSSISFRHWFKNLLLKDIIPAWGHWPEGQLGHWNPASVHDTQYALRKYLLNKWMNGQKKELLNWTYVTPDSV